jgi:uncharacterized RDD family membrane protein YckC
MATTPPPPPDWASRQQVAAGVIGPPAGFWIRVVAYMIDGIILTAAACVVVGIPILIGGLSGDSSGDDDEYSSAIIGAVVIGVLIMIAIGWLYEALLTSSPRGATLGKQAVGLRIVRADGARLSFGRATGRHFLKAMVTPMVPFGIGYILAAFTSGKRAVHDFMADTLVIKSTGDI